ncbi:MAG: hypothetical protein MJZ15_07405 [Bacteroidales bacterium]|nr:hypothetical protein [Bacteroidales bacterium]
MKSGVELAQQASQKVAVVAQRYKALKQRVELLEAECKSLNEQKQQMVEDYNRLSEQFNIYKMSMALSHSGTDGAQARKYLDQMLREIDKCIALLNR